MLNAWGAVKKRIGEVLAPNDPIKYFRSHHYLRHNSRRLEHLTSLNLSVRNRSVLEVGAGIGDHSHYYIDRGCKITITDARPENIRYLREIYPSQNIQILDLDHPSKVAGAPFDICHCYGLLYHLKYPTGALEFLSKNISNLLILETCVSFKNDVQENFINEPHLSPTQAYSGLGCRPSRQWLFSQLQDLFEYVYVPITQPNHEEFPLEWDVPEKHQPPLARAIFIASRELIENPLLTTNLILKQERHN